MTLTADEKQRFEIDGYLIFQGLVDEKMRAKYVPIMQSLVDHASTLLLPSAHFSLAPDAEGKPLPGQLHKVQGVCEVAPALLDLASEPAILDRAEDLIGPNIDMFGSKFFPMNRRGATSTGWHQDNHYFGTDSGRVLSCAIYLEATTVENGCLMVLPQSHRTGELVAHDSGKGVYAHGQWADVDENKAVDVICEPGTVVFFSANLLHGARPNLSGRSSYRTAWHYFPADLKLDLFPRGVYSDRYIVRGT